MAEMMVQRTRAAQAERVWKKFVQLFPSLTDAQAASEEEILVVLRPLGLEWRSRNIAQIVKSMPAGSAVATRGLRGVDHYVASATACFASLERVAVVDSNVVRVYSRFFGFTPSDRIRREAGFHALALQLLPRGRVREYNWALLDLGGTVCVTKPKCGACPLSRKCDFAGLLRARV